MKKFLIFIFISSSCRLFAGAQPPKIYIDKGACPFECCTYREWTARKEVQLVDKPDGKKFIAKIKKSEKVKALTGEVHVVPTPMDIVFNHGKFKVGDRVYLLTNLGEGFQKVWADGVVSDEEVIFIDNYANEDKSCKTPSKECWGRASGKQKSTWWSKIQLKNGKTGWTKETEQFDGQDSCG